MQPSLQNVNLSPKFSKSPRFKRSKISNPCKNVVYQPKKMLRAEDNQRKEGPRLNNLNARKIQRKTKS